jgi:hypothetical protein
LNVGVLPCEVWCQTRGRRNTLFLVIDRTPKVIEVKDHLLWKKPLVSPNNPANARIDESVFVTRNVDAERGIKNETISINEGKRK